MNAWDFRRRWMEQGNNRMHDKNMDVDEQLRGNQIVLFDSFIQPIFYDHCVAS